MPEKKEKSCRICGKDIKDSEAGVDACEYCVRKLNVPAKSKE